MYTVACTVEVYCYYYYCILYYFVIIVTALLLLLMYYHCIFILTLWIIIAIILLITLNTRHYLYKRIFSISLPVCAWISRLWQWWFKGFNPFMPTVPTFAVRETDVSRHNGGTSGAPFKPLIVDSALRALSTLRGLRGAPEVPPLCRETQSLGQQMLERWAKIG